ncbi:MAG: biotin synthase BioB [Akkermansia sp.]|nr:biotin synthase BioB [Akkermansia sp.]
MPAPTCQLAARAIENGGLSRAEAEELLTLPEPELFASATAVREHYFANKVQACFIINAKSGNCNMNCRFCSQSGFNSTEIEHYPFMDEGELDSIVSDWEQYPIGRCGIVTSGGALSDRDVEKLACFIERRASSGKRHPQICGSLGRLKGSAIERLKQAGLTRLHHNLETSERFYPNICTTQTWRDRLDTVHQAMEHGLSVCSGGLFGLGENWGDRIDFAFQLKEEGIRNIPMNFLYPHPGTPLATQPVMPAEEALRIISLFRHLIPDATLRICGGRTSVLKERQYEMFAAGANAFMTGNYLTIAGAGVEVDLAKLAELGLEIDE